MDIKKPIPRKQWKLSVGIKATVIIFSVIVLFLSIISMGVFGLDILKDQGIHKQDILDIIDTVKSPLSFISKWAKGKKAKPETIYIDIKFIDLQKLAYQRELAIAENFLMVGDDAFVSAKVRHGNNKVKVKMRLKGDHLDHLLGDKWSFRIHVKGSKTLFGMKRFSIQHPSTRNFISEWIYHKALKREGIIGLRYDFIKVVLNGKDLGIYAIEEHFEKRLIESNKRREGPIIRFDESLFWENNKWENNELSKELRRQTRFNSSTYIPSEIDAFQTTKYLSDPQLMHMHEKAINLLESFRRGKVKVRDAFDIPVTSKYFALADLLGTQHGTTWNNIRFYYNPVTSKLEPIGFDGSANILPVITSLIGHNRPLGKEGWSYNMYDNIFRDAEFYEAYVKALDTFSSDGYLDKLLAEIAPELQDKMNIIYSEFPYYNFRSKVYYGNLRLIRRFLNPMKGGHAYYEGNDGRSISLKI
ncbi:CotH kinase family protein, partial [Nitrospirota bacterium]